MEKYVEVKYSFVNCKYHGKNYRFRKNVILSPATGMNTIKALLLLILQERKKFSNFTDRLLDVSQGYRGIRWGQ